MAGIVEFVLNHPIPILLVLVLVLVVFRLYLFFRKTVKEFRAGFEN